VSWALGSGAAGQEMVCFYRVWVWFIFIFLSRPTPPFPFAKLPCCPELNLQELGTRRAAANVVDQEKFISKVLLTFIPSYLIYYITNKGEKMNTLVPELIFAALYVGLLTITGVIIW
jgi:hypothetical protein